jgi:hypothetical protein
MDTSTLAIFLAVLSAIISLMSYFQNGEAAQHRRAQNSAMRAIAARAVLAWDDWQTAAQCELRGEAFPEHKFLSARENIRRLEEAIDLALSLGLFKEVMSTKKHSVTYAAASYAAFKEASAVEDAPSFGGIILKLHFTFGLLRALHQVASYRRRLVPEGIMKETKATLRRFGNKPWEYLSAADPNQAQHASVGH